MILTHQITPCLWFDDRIEEAVNFYIATFGGELHESNNYADSGSGKRKVLTMTFTLKDQRFVALNGGPHFTFNEAVSFYVRCETQAEVDYYWNTLTKDGGAESQCGWCKDKYGLSWQIAPTPLLRMISDKDPAKAQRAMQAMMTMKKIDIAGIEKAYNG